MRPGDDHDVSADVHPAAGGARRTRYLDSSLGCVEVLTSTAPCPRRGAEGFSPEFQVALPLRGMFIWHVAHDEVVGDSNQILFVAGGEAYRITAPTTGYQELIITPAPAVLAEIARADAASLSAHPLFRRRCRRADARLQARRARFLSRLTSVADGDAIATEEMVIGLLRAALAPDQPTPRPSPSTARLIRRAKEFLEAELAKPIRLADAGRAVGASPAYLTHVFSRFEGVSLHRYLTGLRLSRALADLPDSGDLTTLALEVGFSSHSHFSAAFRSAYGVSPSQFRHLMGRHVFAMTRGGAESDTVQAQTRSA